MRNMLARFFDFIKTRKGFAIFAVAILLLAGVAVLLLSGGGDPDYRERATLDEILSITSQRDSTQPDAFLVPYEPASYLLASTPISVWYEGSDKNSMPMLALGHNPATQDSGVSRSVKNFLTLYSPSAVAS
ncbi:MAG: hypothetical protein QCI38_06955, partial [Candidatus Thermoplasmatota archaeon]|nr:hypothetical protein [Candidatus Thermoplasmatota archaeon]